MTPHQWKEVIDTNLSGAFNMTHPLWNGMRERKFGRVITISSINGQKGQAGQVNYSASKAGDIGFSKALAQEGARAGITVNVICPGYIATEMVKAIDEKVLNERILPQIPIGRLGEPEEIARCVVFLASDEAGLITGSTITGLGRLTGSAKRSIEAGGRIVTPGFVDIHTHYDGQATWESSLEPSSGHGVTTVVMGNCGWASRLAGRRTGTGWSG